MNYLVAYDITSNKQRKKVADYLERIGVRVNKSVFICRHADREKEVLTKELQSYLRKGDDVFIVPLCKKCEENMIFLNRQKISKRNALTSFV
ncbi:MAG: CRISPR-associated endonuclease Cas2 [Bacteroidetes bacterium]|nr:MAG: CRISPR-associated endonuclease Cas2 [Bacteroidota bacterium]